MNKVFFNLILLFGVLPLFYSCGDSAEEVVPPPSPPMICPADSLVLVDFYHSMKGDEWERPWDLTNPKTWHGVTGKWNSEKGYYDTWMLYITPDICGSHDARLPESIGNLKNLKYFFVEHCKGLTGSLPESLYDCPLETLCVIFCPNLQGPLSPKIGNLRNTLKLLYIADNVSFCSELPKELGECIEADYINLSRNRFYGNIPVELKTIRPRMFLDYNLFTSIDWEWFTDEDVLLIPSMRLNNFTGEVPAEVLESKLWEEDRNFFYPFNEGYGFSNVTDYDNLIIEE